MKQRIVFTGGGTTGHVTKNLVVMEALKKVRPDLDIHYLGVKDGKEAMLVTDDIAHFHAISSGKLRRYFSLETFPDFFRFLRGIWQSFWLLRKLKPKLVFSSGGYVALPVALAAALRGVSVVTHETDSYPGLANRMISRVAKKVLLGYESAAPYFDPSKVSFVGNPIPPSLFEGSRDRALKKLRFDDHKKVLLVMGGSQGAQEINEIVWELLIRLIDQGWQIIHLCGKEKVKTCQQLGLSTTAPYRPYEYVMDEYCDFLTAADLVLCRGGGNSMAEVAALGKPALIIPLLSAAGDHQSKNAEEMVKKHFHWRMIKKPTAEQVLELITEMKNQAVPSSENQVRHVANQIVELLMPFMN